MTASNHPPVREAQLQALERFARDALENYNTRLDPLLIEADDWDIDSVRSGDEFFMASAD